MCCTPEQKAEQRRKWRESAQNWTPAYRANLRAAWRKQWFECLFEFASPALQRRSWVDGTGSWVSSFPECVTEYFDGLALDDESSYADRRDAGMISDAELQIVRRFHEIASSYEPPSRDDRVVLQDPKWAAVVREAKSAISQLRTQLSDPDELRQLADLEAEWGPV